MQKYMDFVILSQIPFTQILTDSILILILVSRINLCINSTYDFDVRVLKQMIIHKEIVYLNLDTINTIYLRLI